MLPKKLLVSLLAAAALAGTQAFAAGALTVDDYLSQVTANSPGLKAANLSAQGYKLTADGASVASLPYFFGSYKNLNDRQQTTSPAFEGNQTLGEQYTMGFSLNSSIGLNAKYSFNLSNNDIRGATALPLENYSSAYNELDLTQSLVRNGFGSETRAQSALIESSNMANSYSNRFSALSQLVQAENTYWRLAFARRAVEVEKDVLARAEKVLQWAKRRVNLQLGDKSDLLQAQASYQLRRIELASEQQEERDAALAFNLLRKREGSEVSESLSLPSVQQTLAMVPPQKSGTRFDVKAAQKQRDATVSSLQLDKEKLKPDVSVFASLAWTGLDKDRSPAMNDAFGSKYSNLAFGLNFSVPLAVPSVVHGLHGTDLTQEAADYNLEQKTLDEHKEWQDAQSRLADAKSRLSLLKDVEKVQKEKYENEQKRLLRGRTTTYQTITFEQDYAATQLTTLQTQNEVLQLLAQMKLFQGE
jgi:outer membrane protein TolC